MPFLLIGIGLLNITDYFFTLQAFSLGAREGNPIMNAIVHTPLFPVVKLIIVPLLLVSVWVSRVKLNRLRNLVMLLLCFSFICYLSVSVYYIALINS